MISDQIDSSNFGFTKLNGIENNRCKQFFELVFKISHTNQIEKLFSFKYKREKSFISRRVKTKRHVTGVHSNTESKPMMILLKLYLFYVIRKYTQNECAAHMFCSQIYAHLVPSLS